MTFSFVTIGNTVVSLLFLHGLKISKYCNHYFRLKNILEEAYKRIFLSWIRCIEECTCLSVLEKHPHLNVWHGYDIHVYSLRLIAFSFLELTASFLDFSPWKTSVLSRFCNLHVCHEVCIKTFYCDKLIVIQDLFAIFHAQILCVIIDKVKQLKWIKLIDKLLKYRTKYIPIIEVWTSYLC